MPRDMLQPLIPALSALKKDTARTALLRRTAKLLRRLPLGSKALILQAANPLFPRGVFGFRRGCPGGQGWGVDAAEVLREEVLARESEWERTSVM